MPPALPVSSSLSTDDQTANVLPPGGLWEALASHRAQLLTAIPTCRLECVIGHLHLVFSQLFKYVIYQV